MPIKAYPPNRYWHKLEPTFRRKLLAVFEDMKGHGLKLFLNEGWRSAERQRWLYDQGRSRKGPIVTYKDGTKNTSYHQSGKAADVYFKNPDGSLYLPSIGAPEWKLLASSAKAHSLTWGGSFRMRDLPHLEWRE